MKNSKLFVAGLYLIALMLTVTGCFEDPKSSAKIEMAQNEENQLHLARVIPPPKLQTSLERKNLVRRLERINREEIVSYIYLISYGKVMAYYPIRGKVSSLNSYLTAMERVERFGSAASTYQYVTMEAPDQDGSYGKNADGVFFFTTEGVYVEWKGEYLWADQPLKVTQPPELIQMVPSK